MKDNIERIFKESLENYAMPYNGAAWDALSKKLDAAPTSPFYKKWWFAASVVTVAAVSTILMLNSSDEAKQEQTVVSFSDARNENVSPASPSGNEDHSSGPQTVTFAQPGSENGPAENTPLQNNPGSQKRAATQEAPADNPGARPFDIPYPGDVISVVPAERTIQVKDRSNNYAKLSLPKTVCLNEELEIFNPNKEELVVVTHPSGKQTGVKAGGKSVFTANSPGTIRVASGTNQYTVEVLRPESPLNIIQISDSPFENGIPEVTLEASGAENSVSWRTNATASSPKGKILVVHPFREMEFEVTATTKDAQGCSVTEKQTVRLDKRYNLLAENAFNPSSNIPRNREFMPEALKIRDVAFNLTIVDPKNGGVVYETSDASQGWDGTDSRNGETVRPNSIWVWKVVIKNPLPGEPVVYNGTVQAVENK